MDAGGFGFITILEGMLDAMRGIHKERTVEQPARAAANFEAIREEDITFTYCTEFIAERKDKARNVGFDWEKKEDVWDKVREELGELQAELAREDKEKSTDEFGDFLFSVINAGRLYHINPDNALERTNRKFIRRFNYVEQHSIRQGRSLKDMTLGEMDALWNEAKEMEKREPTP